MHGRHALPPEEQPKLVEEQRNVPTSDAILGSLISRIPEQNPPNKQTCLLISDVFKDLAEAHQHYAAAAKNLAEVANLVSPEHLTIILAAAVQPKTRLATGPSLVHTQPLQVRLTEKNLYNFVKQPSFRTRHTLTKLRKEHQQEF